MSRIVDNVIAYRILTMLVRPFVETDAYRLGIIDSKGKNLIKPSELNSDQKDAYTVLHRLVFNMKKIINRLPGGENKLKSIVSALFLIKEYYETNNRSTSLMEERFHKLMGMDVILAEETLAVEQFIKKIEEDGGAGVAGAGAGGATVAAPTNVTGSMVSTDIPVPKKKDIDKYKRMNKSSGPLMGVTRRASPM